MNLTRFYTVSFELGGDYWDVEVKAFSSWSAERQVRKDYPLCEIVSSQRVDMCRKIGYSKHMS